MYSNIRLDNRQYDRDTLLTICTDSPWLNKLPAYRKDIFQFIKEWLDDNETILLQTSGSTGEPKNISLKKKHMIGSAKLTQRFFALDEKTNALLCLPVKYIAGKMMIVRAFVSGYNLLTSTPKPNPFKTIKKPLDFTALTPHQLYHSLEDLKRLKIKNIIVGGGEITPELEKEIFGLPAKIYATYGMTETCSHVALRKVNGHGAADYYSALPGITFKTDSRGCLVVLAPGISDKTIVTNDMVDLINSTRFRWLGRFDNVINTGGIKIFPETVEKKISGIIKESFFIGKSSDIALSEKLVLYIEGSKSLAGKEAAVLDSLRRLLEPYEVPKEVVFIGKFTRSGSGKILRDQTLISLKPGGKT
ncbi:MAG: AMP-binding protein [Bacteroidales bacterium]|nr:AMP-binding protein [Bacteroidales bacterium]